MPVIYLLILAFLSGCFGRMGGAGKSGQWYDKILDTKWRDIGCSLVLMCAIYCIFGYNPLYWWAYALTFGFTWAALTTYWDKLFGYDCMWFSGLMVGLAAFPLLAVNVDLWPILALRTGILAVSWECLNRYLPQKGIWIWRRDVAEEFTRYAISL